jgi:uncharacterized protein (TIGR03435 family)
MDDVIDAIRSELGGILVNATGLNGSYDISLEWSPEDSLSDNAALPSLRTALKEQLGLTIVRKTISVDVLVVDSLQLPSAN